MTTHADIYCKTLEELDRKAAINAIYQCRNQLRAMGNRVEIGGTTYDNGPAIQALTDCLRDAGYWPDEK